MYDAYGRSTYIILLLVETDRKIELCRSVRKAKYTKSCHAFHVFFPLLTNIMQIKNKREKKLAKMTKVCDKKNIIIISIIKTINDSKLNRRREMLFA